MEATEEISIALIKLAETLSTTSICDPLRRTVHASAPFPVGNSNA